jgi:[histone H3]-trimethyl-L-lysine4 demethylase
MGFTGIPGLSTQLKNSYTRVILPFEHYSERVRNSPALSPAANRTHDPQLKTHQNIQTPSRMNIAKDSPLRGEIGASPPSSPLSSVSTSSLSDADDADGHGKDLPGKRDQQNGDGGKSLVLTYELNATSIYSGHHSKSTDWSVNATPIC